MVGRDRGVVGALTARGGAGVERALQWARRPPWRRDALNGQMSAASVDRARDAALAGGVLGAAGGAAGRYASDKLSRTEKELLGEDVSRLRTWLRGDKTKPGPKTAEKVPGGRTSPISEAFETALTAKSSNPNSAATRNLRTVSGRPIRRCPTIGSTIACPGMSAWLLGCLGLSLATAGTPTTDSGTC